MHSVADHQMSFTRRCLVFRSFNWTFNVNTLGWTFSRESSASDFHVKTPVMPHLISGIHLRSWRSLGQFLRAWQNSHLPPQNFLLLHLLRPGDQRPAIPNRPATGQYRRHGNRYHRSQAQDVREPLPGKNCDEKDALGLSERPAQLGRTNTYTTHSNGHRKAPKSENAYKLLLHKVYMLRKSRRCDFGDF
jgi:hypothetical protein